jgi:hypothetical protein
LTTVLPGYIKEDLIDRINFYVRGKPWEDIFEPAANIGILLVIANNKDDLGGRGFASCRVIPVLTRNALAS